MPRRLNSFLILTAALLLSLTSAVKADNETVADSDAAVASAEPKGLTIGDPAPKLNIENWIHKGEGKFEEVTEFTEGKVYVVEFWATWCGPCVASMPRLSELQRAYGDRGVTIISVSDEPLEKVSSFLEREAEGQFDAEGNPLTFNDITKHYCLTSDPDESTYTAYMRAANQNGIPCAFIVGKDGRIEWIGHPMSMETSLEKVVTDTWDREAFAAEFKLKELFDKLASEAMMLSKAGRVDEAMARIEELEEQAPSDSFRARLEQVRLRVELNIYQSLVRTDQEAAIEKLAQLVEMVDSDPQAVNSITWIVVQQASRGEVSEKLVSAATAVVRPIYEAGDADASLIDTLAHLVQLEGDLDGAIALEEEAEALATGQLKRAITHYLAELKAVKASQSAEPAGDES